MERQIEIIGEAAGRVSDQCRQEHVEIPWAGIIGQRNVLSHAYDQIDDHRIWLVVAEHVPGLMSQLAALVPRPPQSDSTEKRE